MKMPESMFAELVSALSKVHTPEIQAQYVADGLSEKRYRWDLLHAAQLRGHFCTRYWVCDVAYQAGLHDDHIDTALRQFLKKA